METTQQPSLTIVRTFKATKDQVYSYWTLPENIIKWWGPKGFTCPFAKTDLRIGGKYLFDMRSPEGEDFWSTGEYREIIPGEKLVYTDFFSDENGNIVTASAYGLPGNWPEELVVTVTFEQEGDNTKMTLVHHGMPLEMQNDCNLGWNQSFDKMEENLLK